MRKRDVGRVLVDCKYTLKETVSFVFFRVLIVEGNIRTRGKTKLTSFPREHTLSALY